MAEQTRKFFMLKSCLKLWGVISFSVCVRVRMDGRCLVVASGFLCSLISWWWKEWRGVCNNTIIQSEITGAAVTPAWVTPAPLLAFTGTNFSTLVSVCRVSQYMKCAEASLHPTVSSQNCFFSQSSVNSGWWCFFCSCASFLWLFRTSACRTISSHQQSHMTCPSSLLSWFHSTKPPFSHPPIPGWCGVSVESFPVLFWNAATHFSWTLFCFTPCFYHTFVQSVSQVFQYLLHSPTYHLSPLTSQ